MNGPAKGRRTLLRLLGAGLMAGVVEHSLGGPGTGGDTDPRVAPRPRSSGPTDLGLFLCGDVMTGRGIDQVLPEPGAPEIYEPYMRSALGYVELAERANGPIPAPVDPAYIWGDALEVLEASAPDLRLANLETSVTVSEDRELKGINYRMNPGNIACLTAAGLDCCTLANNHVLDWGTAGLRETLVSLRGAGIDTVGAGENLAEAGAPAMLEVPGRCRVLVFAAGHGSSGIPAHWAATPARPGVNRLPDLSPRTARALAARVRSARAPGDVVVVSIHWGGNWGYAIPPEQQAFARLLIDEGAADVVHGHSSHHPKGIEVYRGRPILYGCGDLINDYEGIGGEDRYRGDLSLLYLLRIDPSSGQLRHLEMVPMRIQRFRLREATAGDGAWMGRTLDRECRPLGGSVSLRESRLALSWD